MTNFRTKEAMGGAMTFQDALRRRLDIISPSQKQIRDFLSSHPSTLSPGIKDLITKLKLRNIEVYLITGGFDFFIEPIAQEVGIPLENIFANKLFFHFNGDYATFDTTQPTSKSGGKGDAISIIRSQRGGNACKITMIGDGATDLEASPPADNFIGLFCFNHHFCFFTTTRKLRLIEVNISMHSKNKLQVSLRCLFKNDTFISY